MLSYEKLSKKSKTFRIFTGRTVEEVNNLCNHIKSQYPGHEAKRLGRKDRKRVLPCFY